MKTISELRRGDCFVFGNHGVGVCGAVREKMGTVAVGFSLMASCGAFFPPFLDNLLPPRLTTRLSANRACLLAVFSGSPCWVSLPVSTSMTIPAAAVARSK